MVLVWLKGRKVPQNSFIVTMRKQIRGRIASLTALATVSCGSSANLAIAFVPPLKTFGCDSSVLIASGIFRRIGSSPTMPILTQIFGDPTGGDSDFDGGETLAKEFYDLVRSRNATAGDDDTSIDTKGSSDGIEAEKQDDSRLNSDQDQQAPQAPSLPANQDEGAIRSSDAFARRREVRGREDREPSVSSPFTTKRKFTGASYSPLDSADTQSTDPFSGDSLFSNPGKGSDQGRTDVRTNMMQREFNLVSFASSGASFGAMAALLVLTLATYIYVGVTGGITDGSERFIEPSEFNGFSETFDSAVDSITKEDWGIGGPPKQGPSVWL